MNLWDTGVLLLYFLILIGIGMIGTRKVNTPEEYVLAGRNLGLVIYCSCLVAVIIGGAATIGAARLGYEHGISGMWFVVMLGFGIMLLGLFFSGAFNRLKVTTISELLGLKYGDQTRLISAGVAVIYTIMVTVTQVIGMGSIIHAILGWELTTSMIVGGGIVIFYTLLGGMWSVTMTDVIQFVIMTVGVFFVMLPRSLSHVGGFSALINQVPATHLDVTHIGGTQIFQYFLLYCLGMVVSQDIWQRVFTARTATVSRTGAVFAGAYSIAWAIALSLIGMCALVALPALEQPQDAFAAMASDILPPGLLGLVLAAVCAALMSNASGSLLASSTLLTNDILVRFLFRDADDRKYIWISKASTLFLGALAITFAIWIQDVLVALDVAYAILSGAIFIPVVLGIFWKKATPKAGFSAVIGGTVVVIGGLALLDITSTDPIMYGMAASLIIMVSVSLLDKRLARQPRASEQQTQL
ncbi:MAG: sodium:solute symporter [Planifilum sp.]|jgi:SSS family solute:Na+ symporter